MKIHDTINDCYVDIFDERPTEQQVINIFENLPEDVLNIARQWGPYDTEFRKNLATWMKTNL